MAKLQRIKRANGSLVYSVNFPLEMMESLKWDKGDDLLLEIEKDEDGKPKIVIRRMTEDG